MTEGEMHHMMEHFVWFRPQYFHQCREEEGSCRPLQQCGGGDLGGTGFPIMCGWDGGSKHYKYCCSGTVSLNSTSSIEMHYDSKLQKWEP